MCISRLNAAFDAALPPAQKLVFLVLCNFANEDGECFPSYAQIAKKASVCKRTVVSAIQDLELQNMIRRDARTGCRTFYIVTNPDEWQLDLRPNRCKSRTGANGSPVQMATVTGANDGTGPVQMAHMTGANAAPTVYIQEPSYKPSIEPSIRAATSANAAPVRSDASKATYSPVEDLLARGVDTQTIADWMQLRKAKKAPVTRTVISILAKEADKADRSLSDVLQLCCMRNWQGFKAEWVNSPTASLQVPRYESPAQESRRKFIESVQNPNRGGRDVFDDF